MRRAMHFEARELQHLLTFLPCFTVQCMVTGDWSALDDVCQQPVHCSLLSSLSPAWLLSRYWHSLDPSVPPIPVSRQSPLSLCPNFCQFSLSSSADTGASGTVPPHAHQRCCCLHIETAVTNMCSSIVVNVRFTSFILDNDKKLWTVNSFEVVEF